MTTPTFDEFVEIFCKAGLGHNYNRMISTVETLDSKEEVRAFYDALFPSVAKGDTVVVQPTFTNYTAMDVMPYAGLDAKLKELAEATTERVKKEAKAALEHSARTLASYEGKWIPIYQCVKQVRAFKIGKIVPDGEVTVLIPDSQALFPFGEQDYIVVCRDYIDKHQPQVGGYYVLYESGYESWSPAQEFERGYIVTNGSEVTIAADGDTITVHRRGAACVYERVDDRWSLRTLGASQS